MVQATPGADMRTVPSIVPAADHGTHGGTTMSELPPRPNLDQLKRQARELQRRSPAGMTLADAQLAIARDYGFASWARLKRHVESAREGTYLLRYVRTPDELRQLWRHLFTILGEPDSDPERRGGAGGGW